MHVETLWEGNLRFRSTGPSGHSVVIDTDPDHGGTDQGPRPMELLLHGLAGCTGIDIVLILQRMRVPLEGFSIQVNAERAEEHPRRFTKIHLHYRFVGTNLPEDKVKRAVGLSVEKYCSASASIAAPIVVTYEVNGQTYTYGTKLPHCVSEGES
ncbi:OsmC family protein [Brockia lithotrophica]|uniref:Putative redox protein n=1 Tax=Brockia lithotrophica TaxID=933949 RepID=A0A660KYU9_9BACL|nr:putative redox protein [Brockia lithotrophica]